MRVLGWTKRDAGSLNPSGTNGLATNWSVRGTATFDIRVGLFVGVIPFAVLRAPTLCDLGPAGLVVVPVVKQQAARFHVDHGGHDIK
jgi:hypothetical protein